MRIDIPHRHRRNEDGVAIIMVIVFLMVMAALISLNGRILSQFKREIELNERRQAQKWNDQTVADTNDETASPAPADAETGKVEE